MTTQCSICHTTAPRYRCPGCRLRTCSAACVRRHKAWSGCSGARDATAYVPRARLRTVAGVDHDYNFLHGLDLSRERAERVLVGDRGLVRASELRGRRGGRTAETRRAGGGTAERLLAHRLRRLGVELVAAPEGMARRRENGTTFHRRSGGVNWAVEWLVWGDDEDEKRDEEEEEDDDKNRNRDGNGDKNRNKNKDDDNDKNRNKDDDNDKDAGAGPAERRLTRRLSKVLESVPLHLAYQALREGKKTTTTTTTTARHGGHQHPHTSTWNAAGAAMQEPSTGRWIHLRGADAAGGPWPRERTEAEQSQFQFFLGRPPTRSSLATTVTALAPTDCLRDALANTRVREFPTVYVLRAGQRLPAGFALGPKDMAAAAAAPQQGAKRRAFPEAAAEDDESNGRRGPTKRRRKGDDDDGGPAGMEEGEVGSDEGGLDGATDGDEEPWAEDEDESPTSSSGTDSDSEGTSS
ncbi:hypothetical protein CDD83_4234 [Cordyceps sp. RAO-2017]|nr:hypothetical protein CDD83_4234 [Cordyceps sp. RAO-2017]